ncbi:MAG TPA: hypothetical protein PKC21_07450 [Oligoflexia bacterium]|nr:hypothetical protein [Oligoflexia bacterium]HMR25171.1 hypothetical protein [Oligoflexia bacterium]
MLNKKLLAMLCLVLAMFVSACPSKNETMGDKVGDAVENTKDNLEEAGEEVSDEIGDATEEVKDEIDDATN